MRPAPELALRIGLAAAVLLSSAAIADDETRTATLKGRLQLELAGTSLEQLGPVVVYLEPTEGEVDFAVPSSPVTVEQRNARFSPSFRAVVRGQTVEMPNADAIYHNVFSFSRPNDFDLGIYPAGESRSVVLEHAGIVKTYCSIHETMNATIFVSPTPWFDVVGSAGAFKIRGVPPGRYLLKTWCEKLPDQSQVVVVPESGSVDVQVLVGTHTGYTDSEVPASLSSSESDGSGRQ